MKHKVHIGAISLWLEMMKSPATRKTAIWVPILALAYVFSPIDIIPDVIPVLGWTDDLMMAFTAFVGLSMWMRNKYSQMAQKAPQPAMVAVSNGQVGREFQL
ncbi:MAG: YkvA family protein [Fimbriimonadaceae bacterium]